MLQEKGGGGGVLRTWKGEGEERICTVVDLGGGGGGGRTPLSFGKTYYGRKHLSVSLITINILTCRALATPMDSGQ